MSHKLLRDLQKDLKSLTQKYGDLSTLPNRLGSDIIKSHPELTKDQAAKLQNIDFNEMAERGLSFNEITEELKSKM